MIKQTVLLLLLLVGLGSAVQAIAAVTNDFVVAETYLVVAPDPGMDDIAVGAIQPEAYLRGTWKTNDPTKVDTYSLQPVVQGKSLVYHALAAELAKRAAAGKQTSTDRGRIKALQSAAAEAQGNASPSLSR